MLTTEIKISRVFIQSLALSIIFPMLVVMASLYDPQYGSLSQAFFGYLGFYLAPALFAALLLSGVALGTFVIAKTRWRSPRSVVASGLSVVVVGVILVAATGQFQQADITSVLVLTICLSALTGPAGTLTHQEYSGKTMPGSIYPTSSDSQKQDTQSLTNK